MPVRFINYVITSFRAVLCQNYHIITSRARVNEIIKSLVKRKAQKGKIRKTTTTRGRFILLFRKQLKFAHQS